MFFILQKYDVILNHGNKFAQFKTIVQSFSVFWGIFRFAKMSKRTLKAGTFFG